MVIFTLVVRVEIETNTKTSTTVRIHYVRRPRGVSARNINTVLFYSLCVRSNIKYVFIVCRSMLCVFVLYAYTYITCITRV